MAIGVADSVGLSTNVCSSSSSLSLPSAFQTLRDLLTSPQFRDGVRLFTIGAAVSASKMIFDSVLGLLKRICVGEATFRGTDEAFRWMLLFVMTQPSFQRSPRAVEVSSRPTLLLDYDLDYRGAYTADGVKATWGSLESTEGDTPSERRELETNDDAAPLGVHFFPPAGESITFTFEGTTVWANRHRESNQGGYEESLTLSYLSLSTAPLRKMIKAARELYQQRQKGRVAIYRINRYMQWQEAANIAKRAEESVHLPHDIKNRLLDDARTFLSAETRTWYSDRGVPYRRGYLFYGVPGSGKTSLVHVLASECNRPIYTLNLSSAGFDNESFLERMGDVPGGALVLIEDVDAAFVDRSASDENKSGRKGGISFSTLLNALDGVGAVEGRLLCMTTNHVERLDPALIRAGRVDLRFEFHHASQEQAKELFLRWYLPRSNNNEPSETNTRKESIGSQGEASVVRAGAESFSKQIPPDLVSVAEIQGFLLARGKDYQRALLEVADWVEEQRRRPRDASPE